MILEIDGMHCDACIRRVTQALGRPGSGDAAKVRLGQAEVAAPPSEAPALIETLEKAGFSARVRSL